jgi:hypothetical protein
LKKLEVVMMKKNTNSIIFLIIVILAVLAYFVYPKLAKTDADPWTMIPDSSTIILQFDKPGDFVKKLKSKDELWHTLISSAVFKKMELELNGLDTIIKDNSTYRELLNNSQLTICFRVDKADNSVSTLFLSKINDNPGLGGIKSYLIKELGAKYAVVDLIERDFGGIKIVDAQKNKTYYLSFIDGLMLVSFNIEMLTDAVKNYRSSSNTELAMDKSLMAVRKTAGKKVDAKLFINYQQLGNFLGLFVNSNNSMAVAKLPGFAAWTELDLIVKHDELLFSGFTITNDSSQLLSLINEQPATENKFFNISPFNTNILLSYNFDQGLLETNTIKGLNYDSRNLRKFIANRVAYGCTATQLSAFGKQSFAIVKFKDRKRGEEELAKICRIARSTHSSRYNGYVIRQIKNKNLLSSLFGDAFKPIKNNYYFFLGDYAVFANSNEMLVNIIQMYDTGKTLDLNDNFKKFSDNMSSKENVSLYIKPDEVLSMASAFVNKETALALLNESELISAIHGASFQFSNDGTFSFTNFYFKLGARVSEENLALWKIQLDDDIVGKPNLVKDHITNRFMVLCYDKNSNVYLINNDGQLLWKKKIKGLPQGDIKQVDYYKNGKIQYLFNTRDYIYLIDKNGNFVRNYPRKLNPAATNSLNLFDYQRRKDYRVLISQADKKTYNYYLNGNKVGGWVEPHSQNIVNETVKRVVANNKDYFLITDIDNNTQIVNRKGNERIKIRGEFKKARNSGFFVNRTNSKGIILTTNEQGKLTYIKANGRLAQTDFGSYSKDHFFLYEDFNGDRSLDFIFVDGRKLKIFDRFKKLLFSYDFDYEINIKPIFFNINRRQSVLGIVSDQEKTIYLFDNKGNIVISRGLVSETPFAVGSLNNNKELNLITASGNTLYNYRLK